MNDNMENNSFENENGFESKVSENNEAPSQETPPAGNPSQNPGQTPHGYGPQFTNPSQNPYNGYYRNPQQGYNPYAYNPVPQAPRLCPSHSLTVLWSCSAWGIRI